MADVITQLKRKTASGYDNIIPQISQNATNAINKQDGTFGKFTEDASGILSTDGYKITKRKVLWSGKFSTTGNITLSEPLKTGDVVRIKYDGNQTGFGYAYKVVGDGSFIHITRPYVYGTKLGSSSTFSFYTTEIYGFSNNSTSLNISATQNFEFNIPTSGNVTVNSLNSASLTILEISTIIE